MGDLNEDEKRKIIVRIAICVVVLLIVMIIGLFL